MIFVVFVVSDSHDCLAHSITLHESQVLANIRELLEQLTEAEASTEGHYVCQVILHPFIMNGAARGYNLVEPQDVSRFSIDFNLEYPRSSIIT